jgi:hypothetical protein
MARLSKILAAATGALLMATLAVAVSPASRSFGAVRAAPSGGGGAGISVAPVQADPSHPVSYFTLKAAGGTQLSEAVVVTNLSTAPVTLTLAAVDGLTGPSTGAVYADEGDPVRRAGAWVSLPQDSLYMPARSAKTVPFTVTVPGGAVPGDHLAGISVQSPPKAPTKGSFQITEIVRSVVGVLVVVPGPATFVPTLSALSIKAIGQTGIGSIVVTLKNTGLLLGKPLLRIALNGPNGYRRTLSKNLDTVLPSDSVPYPFPWPDTLAKGQYHITAWLTGGGVTVELQGNDYVGTKLAGSVPTPAPIVHTIKEHLTLERGLVLVGVGIGGVLVIQFLWLGVRRRRREADA